MSSEPGARSGEKFGSWEFKQKETKKAKTLVCLVAFSRANLRSELRSLSMKKRKLGKSGLEVSAIGLGCMGMSFSYGPPKDKKEMTDLLHAAVERGITFFDTYEVYGPFNTADIVDEMMATLSQNVIK